ncbi:MAG TPA: choice-of-anchor tandem repeat GloVer-containing protein [Bacteroidia bacterium]|nr:choice-of-anchor tandem repeat GloVer-containing protein [Bacteroidia bacterium]
MKNRYLLSFVLLFLGIGISKAQFADIYCFNDTTGATPNGRLAISGNALFGMTEYGGADDYGCVFSIHSDGSNYKDLFDFKGGSFGSRLPMGSLLLVGNKLYGMARGGYYGSGTIFSIDTNGGAYNDLFYFNGTDGCGPTGTLILVGGNLYGMTYGGVTTNPYGNVFSIDTNGSGFRDLYHFDGTTGGNPEADLLLSNNKLYGMTTFEGPYTNWGVIFSIDTNGTGYKDMHNFNDTTGAIPYGDLTLSGGKLYGMTNIGGADSGNNGFIFSIDTNGSGYTDIFAFNGRNGGNPGGSLTLLNGILYGQTGGGADSAGCIFGIDTDGTNYTDLFDFTPTDGYQTNPYNTALTMVGSDMFGILSGGGTHNHGAIFKYKQVITSVNNILFSTNVNAFPNPSNGKFTIQSAGISDKSLVEIYNVLGEKVYSQLSIVNSSLSIDLSNQPAGIYLYRITSERGEFIGSGKLIIQ